jgi:ELWxxDGT repeat protein
LESADVNSDANQGPVLISNKQLFFTKHFGDNAYMASSTGVFGEKRYFTTRSGSNGYSLWQTNGSAEGTFQITEHYLGALNSNTPHKSFALNDAMYFFSDSLNPGLNGLWKVEGSTGEAKRIFPESTEWLLFSNQTNATLGLIVLSGLNKAFFTIQTTDDQMQVWVTDGTTAGTHVLENVRGAQYSNPSMFMDGGNHLLFTALDSTGRAKLWRTDGTHIGSTLVKDLCSQCIGYEVFSD